MATLQVELENPEALRLTVHRTANYRATWAENELRREAETQVNRDRKHLHFGPWHVTGSRWISA